MMHVSLHRRHVKAGNETSRSGQSVGRARRVLWGARGKAGHGNGRDWREERGRMREGGKKRQRERRGAQKRNPGK